jgi:ribonucleoside-diphosphate reductase alpha chain
MFRTELAYENWKSKYRYGDEDPIGTFRRVAKALASVEKSDREMWEEKFFRTIVKWNGELNDFTGLKCTTGGRITANIGTGYKHATLMNCYITGPVAGSKITYKRETFDGKLSHDIVYKSDGSPDDLVNIFLTILEQAKTLASEGGYGINFDFIRPRGSLIKGTGIRHPGIVSYMKVWDSVSECIVKGSNDGYKDKLKDYLKDDDIAEVEGIVKAMTRKGAMMGCLSVSHPDIEEFVRAKQSSGVLTKFNISVLIDDDFMEAVAKDSFYDLTFKGKVHKRVKARELYDLIMESTYNRAEPGVIFVDNMHRNNPLAFLGVANCTNPCGEIPGLPTLSTVCLLGSLNLTQYIEIVDGRPVFDTEAYKQDIVTFTRMLDNVNDLTYNSLPSYDWATKNIRQFGMGLNGVGSALFMLGIPYNSKKAVDFVEELCDIKENVTWQTSALLAADKGTFPAYDKNKFESTEFFKSDRLWPETKKLLRKNGARNGKTTTNPPLGNSSIVCDVVSNGIEPVFLLEYERKAICKKWPTGLSEANVKQVLKYHKENDYEYWRGTYNDREYYYEPHNRGLCKVDMVRDYGYQWLLDNMPDKDHSDYLVTTRDLTVDDHINIQKVVQYHCNQSVSKTSNLPGNYPFEDFKKLYMRAWEEGLNGFTTYREGSMESVISDIKKAEETQDIIEKDIKLPDEFINGPTSIIRREKKKFYINFSYLPEDSDLTFPVAMWIYSNAKYKEKDELKVCNKAARNLAKLALKSGVAKSIVEDAIEKSKSDYPHNRLGRLISLCLRHRVPRADILVSLIGIEGDNVSTLLTAVRKFLSGTLKDGVELKGLACEECGSESVILEGGCKKCIDCGFSGCG